MKTPTRSLLLMGLGAGLLALPALLTLQPGVSQANPQIAQTQENRPVVVELFTSQGCSSCPPADAFLGELAARPDVLALSLHVDYWDYIGWADPFASPEMTARQRAYARAMGSRMVYTPQMVVDGVTDVVGSRKGAVLSAIDRAARTHEVLPVTIDAARGIVRVAAGEAPAGGADVWLVLYEDRHESEVASGENAGRNLVNYRVVREWRRLGTWTGAAFEAPLDGARLNGEPALAAGRGGCAVLVQLPDAGAILGAAAMTLSDGS